MGLLNVSMSYDSLAALAGVGARPGFAPGFASFACHVPCGAKGRAAVAAPAARCGVLLGAAGRRGAAVSPAWVFPPAPPFRRRPLSECGSSAGGQTHPRSLAALVHWGQPHGGHFRLLCRRPSAFAKATADKRAGFIPRRSRRDRPTFSNLSGLGVPCLRLGKLGQRRLKAVFHHSPSSSCSRRSVRAEPLA